MKHERNASPAKLTSAEKGKAVVDSRNPSDANMAVARARSPEPRQLAANGLSPAEKVVEESGRAGGAMMAVAGADFAQTRQLVVDGSIHTMMAVDEEDL